MVNCSTREAFGLFWGHTLTSKFVNNYDNQLRIEVTGL